MITEILRDPVVTSNDDRLRFESFSGCGGVHARLDLLPDALDEAPRASGTTNVDFSSRCGRRWPARPPAARSCSAWAPTRSR